MPSKKTDTPVTIGTLETVNDVFAPEEIFPFFSGTAVYTADFSLPEMRPSSRLILRLGDVRDTAAVYLNGELAGKRLWAPYDVELTDTAKTGENRLRIEVRNNMSNLLYGNPRPFGLRAKPHLAVIGG